MYPPPDESTLSWLGSGLLRRIGLFRTVSSAYTTDMWVSDDTWKIEMLSCLDVPLAHDEFITWLCDPVWGLDLSLREMWCTCDVASDSEHECRFELGHNG